MTSAEIDAAIAGFDWKASTIVGAVGAGVGSFIKMIEAVSVWCQCGRSAACGDAWLTHRFCKALGCNFELFMLPDGRAALLNWSYCYDDETGLLIGTTMLTSQSSADKLDVAFDAIPDALLEGAVDAWARYKKWRHDREEENAHQAQALEGSEPDREHPIDPGGMPRSPDGDEGREADR